MRGFLEDHAPELLLGTTLLLFGAAIAAAAVHDCGQPPCVRTEVRTSTCVEPVIGGKGGVVVVPCALDVCVEWADGGAR